MFTCWQYSTLNHKMSSIGPTSSALQAELLEDKENLPRSQAGPATPLQIDSNRAAQSLSLCVAEGEQRHLTNNRLQLRARKLAIYITGGILILALLVSIGFVLHEKRNISFKTKQDLPADQDAESSPTKYFPTQNDNSLSNPKSDILEVYFEDDLATGKPFTKTIKLNSIHTLNRGKTYFDHDVETLQILQDIPHPTILDVLGEFKEIRSLIINMENNKESKQNYNFNETDIILELKNLKRLEILNSKNNTIPAYVFEIEGNQLESIHFRRCNIGLEMFASFKALLELHAESIKELVILDTYFCNATCKIPNLGLKRGKKITLLRSKKDPI